MRATSPLVAGLGLLLAVPVGAGLLGSGAAAGAGPALLDEPARGRAALTAVGDALDVAAARSGLTPAALGEVLHSDRTAWLDRGGRLFYADPAQDAAAAGGAAPPTADAALPYDQTFLLHSRPSATRVIYLDFDGYDLHDTAWNASGTPALTVPAYTLDADPDFSSAELDVVQEVWARVAEDYAPFAVDVTTQDPGTAGLARTSTGDTAYGSRVSITTQTSLRSTIGGCGGGCAGVAYIGTFDAVMGSGQYPEYYQPAFALPAASYTAAFVAEIVSHEVGHNLGLQHDGLGSSPYYQDSTGTKVWSPIMGAGYTPLTQFSNGDYAGATQTQDDLVVVSQHGPALIADEYGGTTASAQPLGEGDVSATGLIGSRGDLDTFQVTRSCAGSMTATVTPASYGPDLDTRLRLLDSAGAELAAAAPASARGGTWSPVLTGMGASITQSLPAGTYYLEVDGVGLGDPTLGYSDYGSVGRYTLTATGCGGAPPTSSPPTSSPPTFSPPTSTPPTSTAPTSAPPTSTATTSATASSTATATSGPGPVGSGPVYTVPSAPVVRSVKAGHVGWPRTLTLRWRSPASSGGAPLTGFEVRIWKVSPHGKAVRDGTIALDGTTHRLRLVLDDAKYRFTVAATNFVGTGPRSLRTHAVRAR